MAFMYPTHYPSVPFRWDEPAWTATTSSVQEEAVLTAVENRTEAQSASSQIQSAAVRVLGTTMREDDDIMDDLSEELEDEDEAQNSR